jgi:hypothetical protein
MGSSMPITPTMSATEVPNDEFCEVRRRLYLSLQTEPMHLVSLSAALARADDDATDVFHQLVLRARTNSRQAPQYWRSPSSQARRMYWNERQPAHRRAMQPIPTLRSGPRSRPLSTRSELDAVSVRVRECQTSARLKWRIMGAPASFAPNCSIIPVSVRQDK